MEVCYKQKITAIITVVGNTVDEPTFPRRQCCPASVPPVCVRSRCLKLASLANQVSPAQLLVCDILTSVILRPVSPRLSASSSTLFYITHLQYEDGRNTRTYAHTHTHTTKIHHNSWHGRGFSSIVSASRNTLICGQTLVCFLCLVFFSIVHSSISVLSVYQRISLGEIRRVGGGQGRWLSREED